MKKLFNHKYVVRILAFAVLTLAFLVIAAPKIEYYNQTVEREQKELRTKADGYKYPSFGDGKDYRLMTDFYALAACLGVFVSLLTTKRIIFSLLFAGFYVFQGRVILGFIFGIDSEGFGAQFRNDLQAFLYNTLGYELAEFSLIQCIFITGLIALSFWQSSVICHFSRSVSSSLKTKVVNS